ncbi:glutathione transporter ATP-binding protein [Atlantibacter hermannii]|nr:glutathione transporter ATP-binding protein [Atlantibacter hermannii]
MIADEPTTALDVTIQAQILQLIRVLQQEMSMGVIFITHDMGVVADLADRVLVMYQGKRVETAPVNEIFTQPQHPYTKALLAAVPRLGSMKGQTLPRKFPLLNEVAGDEKRPLRDTVITSEGPILQVRDLVTRFPVRSGIFNRVTREVHAVEHVSFDLWPGETLALVGESGCGKSTIGRSLLRLVESESGSITFEGKTYRPAIPVGYAAGAAGHSVHLPGPVRVARSAPDGGVFHHGAAAGAWLDERGRRRGARRLAAGARWAEAGARLGATRMSFPAVSVSVFASPERWR